MYETFAGLRVVVTNQIFEKILRRLIRYFRRWLLIRSMSLYAKRELDGFSKWLASYELAARNSRTVKVIAVFGSDTTHADVARILVVHDQYDCAGGESLA